ncbi:MAG: FAD:protein FMN transferase [Clostridia bacterium]|nr:FAD:protein FMN transferase [Clostridia bacterium]
MDTYCTLEIKGGGEKVLDELEKTVSDYDGKYNAYNENSVMFSFNRDGKCSDKETVLLTQRLLKYNAETEEAYDFTLKKLSDLWGFYKKSVTEPYEIDFDAFGADKVEIKGDTVFLSGVEADFGGVMKGYVTDKLHEKLEEKGIRDAIINLGGNVLAVGSHKVGIQDPGDSNALLCAVSVADKAVVTSGIYQRTFPDQNGVMRHHILDPKTGYPADSGVVSVTVIGDNATECDVLSTAFLVLGRDKTKELSERFGVGVIMLEGDTLYCSEGIAESVEVYDGYTKEVF